MTSLLNLTGNIITVIQIFILYLECNLSFYDTLGENFALKTIKVKSFYISKIHTSVGHLSFLKNAHLVYFNQKATAMVCNFNKK